MSVKPAFVFVHGAWHGAAAWHKLISLLQARGHVARAIDLPGAGVHARVPSSYGRRPLDQAAFASERSPNADVSQEERTRAVIAFIEETRERTGAPIVLVGHSLGGVTVTAVAEAFPDQLHAAVYLCAYMLVPGMNAVTPALIADSLVPGLLKADPMEVGALRIDPRSDDPVYREQMRLTFCGDVSAADFAMELAGLHPDEPAQALLTSPAMTAGRFGQMTRHYIRCLEDQALRLAAQDFMISAVDTAMGNQTRKHTLASSHSPYLSQPDALAEVLLAIAGQSDGVAHPLP